MSNKTVAAVVKLIDDFSGPSSEVKKQARDIEKRFQNMAKVIKDTGKVFESVGNDMTKSLTLPMATIGSAAVKFVGESDDAFSQFAASTGTAAEEMGRYQDAISEVYKNNFGESINEVAEGMGKVKQNMALLGDGDLQGVTEDAFALRDVFGIELTDSTRAADIMMKNLGTTSDEAFNLIAQGAQQGLDFSGELVDSIVDYSPHFQKIGMNAEDMFSVFVSGAKNGAFNLDKVGDAIKEFSILAIDGSDTTAAGFAAIGMDADAMAAKIAAGGDGAKEAFDQVIQGLAGMKDPVAQNAAGVQLFGRWITLCRIKIAQNRWKLNCFIIEFNQFMKQHANTEVINQMA